MSRYLNFIKDFRLGIDQFPTLSNKQIIEIIKEQDTKEYKDFQWLSMHLALDIQRIIAKDPYSTIQDVFNIIESEMSDEIVEIIDQHRKDGQKDGDTLFCKHNLEQKLSAIIGLYEVKQFLHKLRAQLRIHQEREKLGLQTNGTQTLHMVFKGNPGTGKTTIARIVGDLLYDMGILKTKKFVETDRPGLIGKYLGETAQKTKEKVKEAIDGVLFIDEAYALVDNYSDHEGYGKEAIDTLVKCVEDYRERIIVILAGYGDKMDKFMLTNPGLESRFPNIIEFPDYTVDELMMMSKLLFAKHDYQFAEDAEQTIIEIFSHAKKNPQFGNGRFVRNLFEKAVRNQALRLDQCSALTRNDLVTITSQDIML